MECEGATHDGMDTSLYNAILTFAPRKILAPPLLPPLLPLPLLLLLLVMVALVRALRRKNRRRNSERKRIFPGISMNA